jgi:hypothetical protein
MAGIINSFYFFHRKKKGFCLVNDEKKVLYCPLTKTGCTSWKLAMVSSTSTFQREHPNHNMSEILAGQDLKFSIRDKNKLLLDVHDSKVLQKYGIRKINLKDLKIQDYKDYFKFIFVRDPYDRLVSGYSQKLEGHFPDFLNLSIVY